MNAATVIQLAAWIFVLVVTGRRLRHQQAETVALTRVVTSVAVALDDAGADLPVDVRDFIDAYRQHLAQHHADTE